MNKTKIIFALLLLANYHSSAQIIERELTATAGETQTISGTAIVSWSIGEPVTANYFSTNHITQGFQQGEKSAVLPVNLIDFKAKRQTPFVVNLDWEAAWTGNFKGFWIERRLEEETEFEAIQFVKKHELESVQHYFFADENAHTDNSYYRLKMLEEDESFEYSTIRVVEGIPLKHTVTSFPNPFSDHLQFQINPDTRVNPSRIDIELYHSDGAKVLQQTYGFTNQITISALAELPEGWYILNIKIDDQPLESLKLIKSK